MFQTGRSRRVIRNAMKARLTLKPGQRGTKKLYAQYGNQLLYVRYRYDKQRKRRIKTIELVVEEISWLPGIGRITGETVVGLKIGVKESVLRQKVKKLGGIWNPSKNVWELSYKHVVTLELEERIVGV